MIIDCDRCAVRGDACQDCVIGVLLRAPAPASDDLSGHVSDTPPDQLPDTDTQDLERTAAHGPPGASVVQLDAPERRALEVLADQGLVPRLRLVAASPRLERPQSGHHDTRRDAG